MKSNLNQNNKFYISKWTFTFTKAEKIKIMWNIKQKRN